MKQEILTDLINEAVGISVIPRKKLKEDHLFQIISATQEAFNYIKKTQKNFATFNEVKLNTYMQIRLSKMIKSGHWLSKIVEFVGRGGEFINYDSTIMENRPDLFFKIRGNIRVDKIIFVEAKIIYQKKGQSTLLYCQEGVLRFVKGQYAWYESEAMMIGYVKDDSTINNRLVTFFNKAKNPSNSKRFAVKVQPTDVPKLKGDIAYTVHNRKFNYVHKTESKPGPITIWHVWLKL